MGTDGWIELDITHQNTQMLLQQLQTEISRHLDSTTEASIR